MVLVYRSKSRPPLYCPSLQTFLAKERTIRLLYRSEVQMLVLSVQSRALGRRYIVPEMQVREVGARCRYTGQHYPACTPGVLTNTCCSLGLGPTLLGPS